MADKVPLRIKYSGTDAEAFNEFETGDTIAVSHGGTGIASYAVGDILYASAAATLSKLADVATGNALISGGVTTAPAWGKIGLTTHVSGTLPVANGGTGATTFTANGVLYGNTASAIQVTALGTIGQLLRAGTSGVPEWTTATFPATAGSTGTILRSNGTNWVASTATYPDTTTINQLLYSSAANTIVGLATGNSGVLVTNGTGVPSIATDIPTAVTIGSAYIYRAGGTDVPVADGGTGLSTVAQGDIIYASAANTIAGLTKDATSTRYLANTGTDNAPKWDQVNLANGVTGSLPTTNIPVLTCVTDDDGGNLDSTYFGKVIVCTPGGAVTFNLPSVAAGDVGSWLTIVKLAAKQLNIDAADSDTIEDSGAGDTIYSVAADTYASITLMLVTATQWKVINATGTWITTD